MRSFKELAEEFVPKFQRATKTDLHYTGQINGKSYVVPHSYESGGSKKSIRHAIVVSPGYVQHNNASLTPEEAARVHSHIKDIHGGQEVSMKKESWLPMRGPRASEETPEVNEEWENAHSLKGKLKEEKQLALRLGMKSTDRKVAKKPEPESAAQDLEASRKAATLAFARKRGYIKETDMLNEGRPIRGDVAHHHQTAIAKKTLRMNDVGVSIMGGQTKDEARAHLAKMGWSKKQIHDHEHAQFAEEVTVQEDGSKRPIDSLLVFTEKNKEVEQLDELSKPTLKKYIRKAYGDLGHQSGMVAHYASKNYKHPWLVKSSEDEAKKHQRKEKNRGEGLDRALTELGESFMGTYHRNENSHTANIVHLAKHFGHVAVPKSAVIVVEEVTYKVGQNFRIGDDLALLVNTSAKFCVLIMFKNGLRYTKPIKVGNPKRITQKELSKMSDTRAVLVN